MPLRWLSHQGKRMHHLFRVTPGLIHRSGGVGNLYIKTLMVLRYDGLRGIKRQLRRYANVDGTTAVEISDYNDYREWVKRYDTLHDKQRESIKRKLKNMSHYPKISIVMPTHNPDTTWLTEAIASIRNQLYPQWELCIADDASSNPEVRPLLEQFANEDPRIKVRFRENNGHISAASNSALALATGDWIALMDQDDLLPEHALFHIAATINAHPDACLIYSDEDKLDANGARTAPYFKPDWNPDLFLSHNHICHLGVYQSSLIKRIGGFREGFEGAQDYDLALRCVEQLSPDQIVHIPKILYHWRIHPGSTALAGSEKNYALLAGERALNDHFAREKIAARAELLDFGMYRVRYTLPEDLPLVSIIIPTYNGLALLQQCVNSIISKTSYKQYEIIIVDNNSDDADTLRCLDSFADQGNIRVLRDERPFNYSQLNNSAIQHAQGEFVVLMNNDIEVLSEDWLAEMVSIAIQDGVGCVGARLWYPNETLQHGGLIGGIGGVAGHSHKHLPRGEMGYFARANLIQSLLGVTAACLLVRKSIYEEVGGLNAENLKVAFNDVDFCLKVRACGYRNVWTPYAELYHHESATRGYEDTPEKQSRFSSEVLYMQNKWGNTLRKDPAYNPNLTLDREDFSLAWPPRVDEWEKTSAS